MGYVDQIAPAVEPLSLSLIVVSLAAGIGMLLLFRAVSSPSAIRSARRRVQARMLELRLFGDEPRLVWKAQLGLFYANLLYLRAMAKPILIVAIPATLLFPYLDALYGRAPLPVGSATVLTLRYRGAAAPDARLVAPAGLAVESGAVRVPSDHEINWELRAEAPVDRPVRIELGDAAVSKIVRVGSHGEYLTETATAGPLAWLLSPGERLDSSPLIESIHLEYRGRRYSASSWQLPWEAWFILLSMIAAVAGKFYWRVPF